MNPVRPTYPAMSYPHLVAENTYLKHTVAWHAEALTMAHKNAAELEADAMRWRRFKELVDMRQGPGKADQLQQHIDDARESSGSREGRAEG